MFSLTSLLYTWWPSWRTTANCKMALWVFRSNCFHSLENESRKRYLEKIKSVGDIDPYTLKKDELSSDFETFPSICYPDIVNYLLFAPSPLTKEELKNYRSLESYNHFVCGWVRDVAVYSTPSMDNVIITGRVSGLLVLIHKNLMCWTKAQLLRGLYTI